MRFWLIGGVLALVFVIYSLVDAMVIDERRIRSLNRVLWVVLIAVLPVVGGVCWFLFGRGSAARARPLGPDDDPRFTPVAASTTTDPHIAKLEAELKALDDEDFEARFREVTRDAELNAPAAPAAADAADSAPADGAAPSEPEATKPEPRDDSASDTPRRNGSGNDR